MGAVFVSGVANVHSVPTEEYPVRPVAILLSFAMLKVAIACGPKVEAPKSPTRTVVQQRTLDSVIGTSVLPGARVVKGALAVSDSARARRQLADSLANTP